MLLGEDEKKEAKDNAGAAQNGLVWGKVNSDDNTIIVTVCLQIRH